MKFRAHFLISNYVPRGNPSDRKSLIIVLFASGHWQKWSLEELTKEKGGGKNATCHYLLLLFLSCFALGGVGWELWHFLSFIKWHYINPSRLCSFCLVSKNFLETRLTPTEFVQNQTSHYQIPPTVRNTGNANIYLRWSCYNSSRGFCFKLPCQLMISIITGEANCVATVKPIFVWLLSLCDHFCSRVFEECHVCKLDIVLFVW